MIIIELIPVIGGIAAVIAAIFTIKLYILTIKKATVILTFGNGKDRIECKVEENTVLHFFLKNTGNVVVHNVEATIYYLKDLHPVRLS